MKGLGLLLMVLIISTNLFAQKQIDLLLGDSKDLHGLTLGLKVSNLGYGLQATHFFGKKEELKFSWSIDVTNIKHPKEKRLVGIRVADGEQFRYIYGKQNYFYVARPTLGINKRLSSTPAAGSVNLHLVTKLGPAIGLTLPYYLELNYGNNEFFTQFYNADNAQLFLDDQRIIGKGKVFEGIQDARFYFGFTAKVGLLIDLSYNENLFTAFEVGFMADAFLNPIPIMIVKNNRSIYPSIYISLHLGKRKKNDRITGS